MILIEAILKINSTAKVAITDSDINQIEWLDEQHLFLKLT
tara:strand:- start:116 stop:235 length:120 start_codon:yes stop_codon:yes gene_type:complete